MAALVLHTCQENGQVISFSMKLEIQRVMVLLYNLIAVASAKSKTEVDHPGPWEKVDITGVLLLVDQDDLGGQFHWVPVGSLSELVPVDWLGVLQVVLQIVKDIDRVMHIIEHLMLRSQWCLRDLWLCRGSMCKYQPCS